MTLFASHELGCDIEGVRERMQDLVQVLPDLSKTIMLSQPPCAGRIFAITNAYDACVVKQATPSHSTICCFWFTSIAKWCSGGLKLCCICTDISIPEKGLNQHICKFWVHAKLKCACACRQEGAPHEAWAASSSVARHTCCC